MFDELARTSVFKGIKTSEIIQLLGSIHYQVRTYEPENVIAYAADTCQDLYILLEGHLRGEMNTFNNQNIIVSEVEAPDTVAEAFLFADKNKLLINIIATTNAKILFIPKSELLKLLNNNIKILSNYLNATSNRFVIVSEKLRFLLYKSVKGKIASYLLGLEKENKDKTSFRIGKTHEELAALFGITRPALTRNILMLKKEGIIEMKNKEVQILNREKLIQQLN